VYKLYTGARQHPSYGDCLEFKREYYQNCSVLGCVTQCSQQHTHMSSSYRSSRLDFWHWDPYAMHRGGCLELYYFITTWQSCPGGIQALFERPTGFLHCFDAVGLVIWPVKIVPNMTYNVFGRTLNLAQSINPLVPKLLTLNDLERCNGSDFACFYRHRDIWWPVVSQYLEFRLILSATEMYPSEWL